MPNFHVGLTWYQSDPFPALLQSEFGYFLSLSDLPFLLECFHFPEYLKHLKTWNIEGWSLHREQFELPHSSTVYMENEILVHWTWKHSARNELTTFTVVASLGHALSLLHVGPYSTVITLVYCFLNVGVHPGKFDSHTSLRFGYTPLIVHRYQYNIALPYHTIIPHSGTYIEYMYPLHAPNPVG